jgi:hypothetical protein
MKRLEAATLGAGSVLIVVALAFVDWRIGMATAGFLLVLASVDLPRRRP